MQKAKWYRQKENVCICECCPNECIIAPHQSGLCGTYTNIDQKLWNQRYYKFSSICIDPLEKKPLYHFFPGKSILSLGGYGCNLTCFYCQNHSISQNHSLGETLSLEFIVAQACKHHAVGIALTYNEPLVNIETAIDLFSFCKKNNLETVLVTNGYINEKPLLELVPFVDAANVDVKFSTTDSYKKYAGGRLEPVVNAIKIIAQHCSTEVTHLVVPGINDSTSSVDDICSIISSINPSIPVHFSAYYPQWKSRIPGTSPESIRSICQQAKKTLSFVYGGNISPQNDPDLYNTYCPTCHSLWIERMQSRVRIHNITHNTCSICGRNITEFKGLES